MSSNFKKITYWTSIITIGIVFGLALQFAKAWVEPGQNPPSDNVGAPLNTGQLTQKKDGAMRLDKGMILNEGIIGGPAANGLVVANGTTSTGDIAANTSLLTSYYFNYTGSDSGNNNILFAGKRGAEYFGVKTNGNVGIGISSPSQKLDVNGSIRATDVCTTGGKCLSMAGGGLDWDNPAPFSATDNRSGPAATSTPIAYKLCVLSYEYVEHSGACSVVRKAGGFWDINAAGSSGMGFYVSCSMNCYN